LAPRFLPECGLVSAHLRPYVVKAEVKKL
jgi:hypothetical protein